MAKEAILLYIDNLKKYNEDIPSDDSTLEYNLKVGINGQATFLKPNRPYKITREEWFYFYSRSSSHIFVFPLT